MKKKILLLIIFEIILWAVYTIVNNILYGEKIKYSYNEKNMFPIIYCVIGILLVIFCFFIYYKILYYKTKKFTLIKNKISSYITECNELNEHIETLKEIDENFNSNNLETSMVENNNIGNYNYKRKALNLYNDRKKVYDCSLSVLKSANDQPLKYLCKYFNFNADENTICQLENLLNKFLAVEQGKHLLIQKKDKIIQSIENEIPFFIRKYDRTNLEKHLQFKKLDLSQSYYPKYTFRYISAGGNSGRETSIVLNTDTLEKLIVYLSEKIKFQNSVKGQRQLMTKKLREEIKARDNYTCKCCNVSVKDEPHLLLEIDHIIPISKGGLTTPDNLQTLCWKCNRTKGSKILE